MNEIFFTSDTHFCHNLMATGRGYSCYEKMNEDIINKWNSIINKKDIVYHLGDFGFKSRIDNLKHIRYRLNGKIILIVGNHDIKNRIHTQPWWTDVKALYSLKINKEIYVLCHFPMRVWDKSHYNSAHFYGHVHTGFNFHTQYVHGKSIDVGWDWWKSPVNFEILKFKLSELPDNPNLIRR